MPYSFEDRTLVKDMREFINIESSKTVLFDALKSQVERAEAAEAQLHDCVADGMKMASTLYQTGKEIDDLTAELAQLRIVCANFTGYVILVEFPDEEPPSGDECFVSSIDGHASFASTVGKIKNFREQIEGLFPAPEGCRWAFSRQTAQVVRDA